jgi:hypothetical protein
MVMKRCRSLHPHLLAFAPEDQLDHFDFFSAHTISPLTEAFSRVGSLAL